LRNYEKNHLGIFPHIRRGSGVTGLVLVTALYRIRRTLKVRLIRYSVLAASMPGPSSSRLAVGPNNDLIQRTMAAKKRGKSAQGCNLTKEELQRRLQAQERELVKLRLRIQELEAEVQLLQASHDASAGLSRERKNSWKNDRAITEFLESIPKTEEDWTKRRDLVKLSTPKDVIRAFYLLTAGIVLPEIETKPNNQCTIGQTLKKYKQLVNWLGQRSTSANQIFNIGQLLFTCLCCVARKNGSSVEEIDGLMNEMLPKRERVKQLQGSYLSKIRTAARWPIAQEKRLQESLGSRANEFFLLCIAPLKKFLGNY
jgi:hypothetical protein